MKFILINGRTPRPQAVCVSCREPIATGYLREIGTRLCYCDDDATPAAASAASLPSKIMRGHREFEATDDVGIYVYRSRFLPAVATIVRREWPPAISRSQKPGAARRRAAPRSPGLSDNREQGIGC